MSHNCDAEPRNVGELVQALSKLHPDLPVYETWNEGPGWFEVGEADGSPIVWLGIHAPCSREDNPDRVTLAEVEESIRRFDSVHDVL